MGRKEEEEGEGEWGEECVCAHTPLINGICSEEKDLLLQCEVVFFHFPFEDGRDCACSISWKPFLEFLLHLCPVLAEVRTTV